MRVVIIGSGNVAEAMAIALHKNGISPIQICARNRAEASNIATKVGCSHTDDFSKIADADIYLIAVSDSAIDIVSAQLSVREAIVLHTAGSVDISALNKHYNYGVFYPLQTFTKGREVEFSEIPILIEANTKTTLATIKTIAQKLSNNVIETDINYRTKLHLAAVFACNFTNHMYTIAESLLHEDNISFDTLKPLIKETANKAIDSKSPLLTQTGPAVRDDFKTKNRHCEVLANRLITKNIYVTLSRNIWETSKKILQR